MADTATAEPDLSGLTNSPPQKRKRGVPDSSPSEPRRTKRAAAAMDSTEPTPNVFLDNAMDTAQAAAAGVNVSDFNALQQAAAGEHSDAADPANASSTAAAALEYPNIHVPQTTEETFAAQSGIEDEHPPHIPYQAPDVAHADGLPMPSQSPLPAANIQPANGIHHEQPRYSAQPAPKPAVGSEEWHKQRKDNHKEVERRRRETINEGINELAKIVPGCEKNKGSILQRAVSYITQLKDADSQNVEKWTLEKLLTEQAISELSSSNDKLKAECDRLYRELETWKRVAQNAGLSPTESKAEHSSSS